MLCQALGVSTSGYYDWRERLERPARRTVFDEFLTEQIREIHTQSRGTYGSPRVHAELVLGEGIRVGQKRVERLMRQAGLEGIYRRKKHFTTRRDPKAALSDDLVNRQFSVDRPDALWVGDVTEHPTAEGKVYLATVIDAFSRRVVGWSIADHLRAEIVVDALQMAIWRRNGREAGTVMHTDHGSQTGLNWSSQHLDDGGDAWVLENGSELFSCIGDRSPHRGDRRLRGVATGSHSGRRSVEG